ncbi:MutS-related protein, partial [Clostridium perfringens]
EKGVGNSFYINNDKRVILITGSNMSGNSTFLRTVGLNCILAYLGLPVKVESFEAPILNFYTCMRTGDILEESISSFYE